MRSAGKYVSEMIILCRVGHKTLTQSINQPTYLLSRVVAWRSGGVVGLDQRS